MKYSQPEYFYRDRENNVFVHTKTRENCVIFHAFTRKFTYAQTWTSRTVYRPTLHDSKNQGHFDFWSFPNRKLHGLIKFFSLRSLLITKQERPAAAMVLEEEKWMQVTLLSRSPYHPRSCTTIDKAELWKTVSWTIQSCVTPSPALCFQALYFAFCFTSQTSCHNAC